MELNKLDLWWSTLTVKEKERIATKIARIDNPDAPEQTYPSCSYLWQKMSAETKQKVHDHCHDDHGLVMEKWTEGRPMSY